MAERYGVSLTAAVLRWVEYTETRAIVVVSTDGFVLWARSSEAAFKSRLFIRTKVAPHEMPSNSIAVMREFSEEAKGGMARAPDVWGFPERCIELCIRSERYNQEITLLHFDMPEPVDVPEPLSFDVYDRFIKGDQPISIPMRSAR